MMKIRFVRNVFSLLITLVGSSDLCHLHLFVFMVIMCTLFHKFDVILIFSVWRHHFEHISSPPVFQVSLSECASTPGPAAAPARWRMATWQPFAARRSRRCDPTALNWSTWLLGTPRHIKVRERRSQRESPFRKVRSVIHHLGKGPKSQRRTAFSVSEQWHGQTESLKG